MIRGLTVMVLATGCVGQGSGEDVTGPFTGTPRRYVIDSIELPHNNTEARELGTDLTDDRTVDNQLGMVIATLTQYDDITSHGDDMLASGAIASWVILRADDYWSDSTVSVTYYGSDGASATRVGGVFEDGVFVSNRSATTQVPGDAIARLPIFADADPSDVPLWSVQMTLTPIGDGFDAAISGAISYEDAIDQTFVGLQQMIANNPNAHRYMLAVLDKDNSHDLVRTELSENSLMQSLLAPDVTIQGRKGLSLGFHAHLKPCDSGTCIDAPPEHTCFDRVKDGDESDVDCGGSCRACKTHEACTSGTDCESAACDAGTCRAPSCSDGVRDGFETDVDCGSACGPCALGERCYYDSDCASGECGVPCPPNSTGCYDVPTFDTCR